MHTLTIRFGTKPGDYPPGNKVTDTIFRRGKVSAIMLDNVSNNTDFLQDQERGVLDLSAFNSINANSTLTIFFETAV